jgi:hypothetical protein
MSDELNRAIYARLAGVEALSGVYGAAQANLAALLGVDPDTGAPAVYYSSTSQAQGADGSGNAVPVYPAITFAPEGGMPHPTQTTPEGISKKWVFVGFSIWTDAVQTQARTGKDVGRVIAQVADILELLLDWTQNAPMLPLETGKVDEQSLMTNVQTIPRAKTHEWQGYLRWKFIELQAHGARVV